MRKRSSLAMNLDAVAVRAGVSASTVSRALNNLEIVKTSTRYRVLKAVQELSYHPNLHACSLARGKSRILGIIVSNMENPFFLDIYRTLEFDAHGRGLEVIVANTNYRAERLVASVQLMIGLRTAGLGVVVSEMDEHVIQTVANSRGLSQGNQENRRLPQLLGPSPHSFHWASLHSRPYQRASENFSGVRSSISPRCGG